MPIDHNTALAAGAIDFRTVDPTTFFSANDNNYRFASDLIGQDSAAVGVTPEAPLLVSAQGVSDPFGVWNVGYKSGAHTFQNVKISTPQQPQFANINTDLKQVALGPIEQGFNFVKDPNPKSPLFLIQDPSTKLVWEVVQDTAGKPEIVLGQQDNSSKQLWALIQASN